MILKIKKGKQWIFYDNIEQFVNHGFFRLDGEGRIIWNENGKSDDEFYFPVSCRHINDNNKIRTISVKEKGNTVEVAPACIVVSITQRFDGKTIAFNDPAYLLNDQGKTIESL